MPLKSKHKPRVGIFMPAYNQGVYIHEAIASLKAQTFQDFEVAIVDDASTDAVTIPILEKIDYSKARVYFHEKNSGVGKLARTYYKSLGNEYIFVLCADDKLRPTFIAECIEYLDSHPKCGAVATYIEQFGEATGIIELNKNKATLPSLLVNNHFLGSSMMRFESLSQINFGNTRKEFQRHNDYDRWVSMTELGWELGIIQKPLFQYRILRKSLSHSIDVKQELSFRKAFIEKHQSLFYHHHKYVLLKLYEKIFSLENWQNELSDGKDWLDSQYHNLLEENKDLREQLTKKEEEISRMRHRMRHITRAFNLISRLIYRDPRD